MQAEAGAKQQGGHPVEDRDEENRPEKEHRQLDGDVSRKPRRTPSAEYHAVNGAGQTDEDDERDDSAPAYATAADLVPKRRSVT